VLSFFFQVYGGAISATVGSYAWSSIPIGIGNSESYGTRCINCHMRVTNLSISESIAFSSNRDQKFSASSQGVFVSAALL
jgi:hypothetical protein